MAKIKYELFKNRKRFNIQKWIKSSQNNSYNDLKLFLEERSVLPPLEEDFQSELDLFNKLELEKNATTEIDLQIHEKTQEVEKEPDDRVARRKRRRKKQEDEN